MPAAFDRCVKDVKRKDGGKNPYAICRASLGTDQQIRARQRRKPTRGKRRA